MCVCALSRTNRTTLENMDPSIPSARLSGTHLRDLDRPYPQRSSLEQRHSQRERTRWRPDHVLSRDERRKARREASEMNVYDLGWKENFKQVFDPDGQDPYWRWLWPGGRAGSRDPFAGHTFPHSSKALAELRETTARLRLGKTLDDEGTD